MKNCNEDAVITYNLISHTAKEMILLKFGIPLSDEIKIFKIFTFAIMIFSSSCIKSALHNFMRQLFHFHLISRLLHLKILVSFFSYCLLIFRAGRKQMCILVFFSRIIITCWYRLTRVMYNSSRNFASVPDFQ